LPVASVLFMDIVQNTLHPLSKTRTYIDTKKTTTL